MKLEDIKDVTVVADAWGQGVPVTLLGREINDNGVDNQAKLIIYDPFYHGVALIPNDLAFEQY